MRERRWFGGAGTAHHRWPTTVGRALPARTPIAVLLVLATWPARADDPALSLADLAQYRTALIDRDPVPPPLPVSFRALWEHPEAYQGRRVQVEARVVRRFGQGSFGTFPPLVEAWAVTPQGEAFCWVFPEPGAGKTSPPATATVRFVGTYLKRIRYQGADVPRLAPLIVGPGPPTAVPASSTAAGLPGWPGSRVDWIVGLAAALVVAAVVVGHHLRKPPRRSSALELGPAPDFVSGQSVSHDDAERPLDIT